MKPFISSVALLMLVLTACSTPATSQADPAPVQASAAAAASTMVALTQAALPTALPTLAPTEAPLPSPTVFATPTPQPPAGFPTPESPVPVSSGSGANCVRPLDMGSAGPTHRTLLMNQTGATVNISLTLYKPNAFGQCGSISFANIGGSSNVMADLPSGYWYAYAWATAKGKNFTVSGSFYVQPSVFDKLELCIRSRFIKYTPQC